MLSKQVKARIRRNKLKRATPKKRDLIHIRRAMILSSMWFNRNVVVGKHTPVSPLYVKGLHITGEEDKSEFVKRYECSLEEEQALRQQYADEDRKYFNGWRKGYK